MMSINLALVIVLSVMVAVLWCQKCPEGFAGNFNNRNINADARRGPGTGKYNSRALSPAGWFEHKPVLKEGFSGGCGCGF